MKRLLALLTFLALLPACALAFDAAPYLLPAIDPAELALSLTPLSADDVYWVRLTPIEQDERTLYAKQLQRFSGGARTQSFLLDADQDSGYEIILSPDGGLRLLRGDVRENETYRWKKDYTLYDADSGSLQNPRTFSGDPYTLVPVDGGFAGACALQDEQSRILLYGSDAAPVLQIDVPCADAVIQSSARSGDARLLLVQPNAATEPSTLLRIEDEALCWNFALNSVDAFYNAVHAFSRDGALLTGPLEADYMRYIATNIDAQGNILWAKTFSAKKAITHPKRTVVSSDGTTTVYGSCVAASRGLYTAFAMTLDADGRVLSLDVRDTSVDDASYNDTDVDFLLTPQGEVLVYMTPTLHHASVDVLVPFDDLPAAKDPGIHLR